MAVKRAARWDLLSAQLGPALDGANDVVEVVGDAAGQLADGFKLLHLAELLFEGPPLGHVLGDAFEASDTDRRVPRRPPAPTHQDRRTILALPLHFQAFDPVAAGCLPQQVRPCDGVAVNG